MSDSILNIVISTVKRGGGDKETVNGLKKVSNTFKELTGFSLSSATAIGVGMMALKKLNQVAKESIQTTVDLGNQTESLQLKMGGSAETVSRFAQVVDDARIPFESLERAIEAAAKKGLDVSVPALAAMSDEFRSLKTEQEQNLFLTERFGKQGLDFEKVMKLGSAAIYQRMGAVSDSLVMDEQAIQATIEYQESMDALGDSVDGVKNKIGKELTPIVGDYALVLSDLIERTNKGDGTFLKTLETIGRFVPLTSSIISGISGLNTIMGKNADKLRAQQAQQALNNQGMREYKDAVMRTWDVLDIGLNPSLDITSRRMGSLAFETSEASNNLIDISESSENAAGEVEKLDKKLRSLDDISPSFGSEIQSELGKLAFLQAGGMIYQNIYAQIKAAWSAGTITNEEATRMFQEAYLGAASVELKMGESKDTVITGIMETFDATYAEATTLLDNFISEQSKKTITLQVQLATAGLSSDVAALIQAQTSSGGMGMNIGGGMSAGGSFTVPPGHPNDSFGPIFFESGEQVQVTPANQVSNNGGNTYIYNINGANTAEVMRQLKLQGAF